MPLKRGLSLIYFLDLPLFDDKRDTITLSTLQGEVKTLSRLLYPDSPHPDISELTRP